MYHILYDIRTYYTSVNFMYFSLEDMPKMFLSSELIRIFVIFFPTGEQPSMVDFFIYPWFERFPAVRKVIPDWDPLPADVYPKLTAWIQAMQSVPAVQACALSTEMHEGFIRSLVEHGKPDVNFGLE